MPAANAAVAASSTSSAAANGHYATAINQQSDLSNKLNSLDSLDACSSPGSAAQLLSQNKRRKRGQESLTETFRLWVVEHQIGIIINLLLLLALPHIFIPAARQWTTPYFKLSYQDPLTGLYARGTLDFRFVATWTVLFTGMRAVVMSYLLFPLAQMIGIKSTKGRVRFAEQGWLALYYTCSSSLGLYIWYNSPYWGNFAKLWADFPIVQLNTIDKWYYLVQLGFWFHQILVVHIEEKRKDHYQMVTHHIITCALLLTSYGYFQTRVGNVILFLMDIADIFLSLAKMLRYTGWQTICDTIFGVFILSWIITRHGIYLAVCRSIYADVPIVMTPGIYSSATGKLLSTDISHVRYTVSSVLQNIFSPFLKPGAPIWYTPDMRFVYLSLLLALQCLIVMWLVLILRIAVNVILGHGADDTRSEADEESEVEDEDLSETAEDASPIDVTAAPLEQEVGVEGLNLKRRPGTRKHREARTNSNGFSVAGGAAAKKELLGRIGCDKPA